MDVFELVEQRCTVVPRHLRRALDYVVAAQRTDWNEGDVDDLELGRKVAEFRDDFVEALLAPIDKVHLVNADDHVRDSQQRRDESVTARLLRNPVACVDQYDGEVGGRGTGDHVARVVNVAGGVGDDEPAMGGGEVSVGDVDCDSLLTLGAEAVCEQRKVNAAIVAVPSQRCFTELLELVFKNGFCVVEQPPDQCAFPVINRASGGEAE